MRLFKNRKGLSLVEAVVSIMVIGIIVVVGLDAPVLLRGNFTGQRTNFTSVNLINSQIEDLREIAIRGGSGAKGGELLEGDHTATENILGAPEGVNVSYNIEYGDWNEDGGPEDVDFRTIRATYTYPDGREINMTGFVVE